MARSALYTSKQLKNEKKIVKMIKKCKKIKFENQNVNKKNQRSKCESLKLRG